MGKIERGATPAAASLGDGRVLLAAPMPLGGIGVRLFDNHWHRVRIVPLNVASVAVAASSTSDVHLLGVTDGAAIVHVRLDLTTGAASDPVKIPNPFGQDMPRIELHQAGGNLFALLRPPTDDDTRPMHTATLEGHVWRSPTPLTKAPGKAQADHIRIGAISRGVPHFLALSPDRRIAVQEPSGGEPIALIGAPVAVSAGGDDVYGVAFGITGDLRLITNFRNAEGWQGWISLPRGRVEDRVAGVFSDHSQRRLDEIARRARLI
ncbi:MAG TPA: hypothetical protein VEU30_14195 [Thermoanaerobaculia bacterium]|nr:hypothetical protein [Thermoanaerobaculia bacterium]